MGLDYVNYLQDSKYLNSVSCIPPFLFTSHKVHMIDGFQASSTYIFLHITKNIYWRFGSALNGMGSLDHLRNLDETRDIIYKSK